MDKRKLIDKIASHFDLDETGVSIFVDSIFNTISKTLNKGKNINIPEFGKFIVRSRTIDGECQRYITFSPSKKFAEEINNNYSDLNPVAIKMLQPDGTGIEIKEITFEYGEDNFAYLTFEDDIETEPEITYPDDEPLIDEIVPEEVRYFSEIKPEEVIFESESEEQSLADVPYLITITKDKYPYIQDEKTEEVLSDANETFAPKAEQIYVTEQIQDKEEIAETEQIPDKEEIAETEQIPDKEETTDIEQTPDTEEITDIEQTPDTEEITETEQTPDTEEIAETEQIPDKEEITETEQTPDTEEITETEHKGYLLLPESLIEEDNYIEVLEEQIIAEKEIIIRDIEDYLFKERKSEDQKEENDGINEPDSYLNDSSEDPDNYFKRENVYRVSDEEDKAVFDDKDLDEKTQNVFLYDFSETDFGTREKEVNPEQDIEQNVFLDLENFFNGNKDKDTDLKTGLEESVENQKTESPSGFSSEAKEESQVNENTDYEDETPVKHFTLLKDGLDTAKLEEEILEMLASREKSIKDINEFGLNLETNIALQPTEDSTDDNKKKDMDTLEEVIVPEITQQNTIKDESERVDEKSEIQDTSDINIDEELNKRFRELEELAKVKSIISEEAKRNLLNSEIIIFDRLIEEKPAPVKESPPPKPIPQIIIHDPGSRTIEKEPKSLSEALEDVHLDGIIEHLEGSKVDSEVKSYDDVFKTSDMPFIPNSNPEIIFKKTKNWLKFFLYLFFIIIFSMISFFLYKSILTPSRSTQYLDTTGIKKYDSLSANLTLVDSSFKTGSITLNEFEIEKDGEIIYRQTENGFVVQIATFEKHSDALKFITNLKDKSIDARIERVDLPLDKTEYRIVIGPFTTLQEAKAYFSSSRMMLNYIKILTPSNTNFFF